jgi:alkylation response protein AidB-like acyl-CoA dehydrogenase
MDLRDTPAEAEFREKLRSWLNEHNPGPLPAEHGEHREALLKWHRTLYAAGWVGLSWPAEYGGQGLGPMEEAILQQELGRAGAPEPPAIGFIGRAIMAYGTAAQKTKYLPGLLRSEHVWCQGFSEPDAGSDLASLRTTGTQEGDYFRVSGTKIWTSRARYANYCFLLARTGRDLPRHRGISALIVDMRTAGIEVRPIVEATGNDHHFTQVFFDDVLVPSENLVGAVNEGWSVATQLLSYERGPAELGLQAGYATLYKRLIEEVKRRGLESDAEIRRSCARPAVALEVLRLRTLRALTERKHGVKPGPEVSVDKVLMAGVDQLLLHTAQMALGTELSLFDEEWFNRYLHSRAATIYGGTAQIQRNVLAERVLGLPRSRDGGAKRDGVQSH